MIAAPVEATAPAAMVFAPPLDTRLVYDLLRVDPGAHGESEIASVRALRFSRAAGGYVATAVTESVVIRAPARTRAALEALFAPVIGIELRMRVDDGGAPGALIDEAVSTAALRRSVGALAARIAGDPAVPAEVKTMAAAALVREAESGRLAAQSREAVLLVLPPSFPGLAPGATGTFETVIDGPTGPLPATGTVTRLADDSGAARFRSVIRSAADAGDAAARSLRAQAGDLRAEAAARLEGMAATLAGSRFVERTDVAIDRKTGLLLSQTSVRVAVDAAGGERLLARREALLKR